jgi:hypothetical protein
MTDFSRDLKLNAAAICLAQAVYYGRHTVWGGDGRHFDALSTAEKRAWIQLGADVLRAVKQPGRDRENTSAILQTSVWTPCGPERSGTSGHLTQISTGLRPTHGPVIGMIQPSTKGA